VSYDVVVAGAGITGLLTGLLFARAGLSVALLEAREVAAATTGNTTAKVSVLQGTKLSQLRRSHPDATVREYVDANLEGQAWIRRYCDDHQVPYQARPAFTYATTEAGHAAAQAELDAARAVGLPATWNPDPGLPFRTLGAVELADQLQLHPMDLVDALVEELAAEGAVIHEWSRVTGLRKRGGGVQLEVAGVRVDARHAVLATSQPVTFRGGFFARLKSQRSYAAALRSSWVAPGMYLSSDRVTRSVRSVPGPDDRELLLVGGNGHVTGRGPAPSKQLDGLIAWARSTFPVSEVTHTWSAQDHQSISKLPYVGSATPSDDRILVATGFDKWGFTNAGAAALLLSKTVLGGAPEWAGALRSWAPRDLGSLPTALLFNGSVGAQVADGWLRRVPIGDGAEPQEGQGRVTRDGIHPTAECVLAGQRHRVSAICPHAGGILRWNDAEHSWDCPLHGSRFAADGSVLEGPATRGLDAR
jgi:glycine/D-amino acid oxidase-like deaminating enzyme